MKLSHVFLLAITVMFSVLVFANVHVHGRYHKENVTIHTSLNK